MRFLVIALVFLISCDSKPTVADLKFPNPEREGIIEHKVKEVLGVIDVPPTDVDTVERFYYDNAGLVTREKSVRYYKDYYYSYDKNGILDSVSGFETDIAFKRDIENEFYPDSLVLYRYYQGMLSNIYRFDNNFKLSTISYINGGGKVMYTKWHFYDVHSRLVKDSIQYPNNEFITNRYFYAGRLDSIITHSINFGLPEDTAIYFDSLGIRKLKVTKAISVSSETMEPVGPVEDRIRYVYKTF